MGSSRFGFRRVWVGAAVDHKLGSLARRSSRHQQRRSGPWRYWISDGPRAISRFLRLFAAGDNRLHHPPSHAPRRLDAFNRIGRPVQRPEHGFLNQVARASIVVGTDKLTRFHVASSNGGVGSNIQTKRYRCAGFGGSERVHDFETGGF